MRKGVTITLIFLVGITASAAPTVGYCYPAGVETGRRMRIVVGGQRLDGVTGGYVSGEGVEITAVERVPRRVQNMGDGQGAWLMEWLRRLEDGVVGRPELPKDEMLSTWVRNSWWESLDKLDALSRSLVARTQFGPRPDPLQAAPAISERLILDVAVRPDAPPGVRRLVLFGRNEASAPHPFLVTVEPHAAEPLYALPPRKDQRRVPKMPAVLSLPVVLDGQILPGETDVFRLSLSGGTRLACLLTGRELTPYLGDAVPGFFNPVLRLVDEDGKEVAFADDFSYLPDPVLTCRIEKTGIYRLEVRDNLYRGRDDFVYSVICTDDEDLSPTPQERAFVCQVKPDARGERSEVVPCPGARVSFDFEVKEPGEWTFDLFARRIGSPLDGVMKLYGPMEGWIWKDGPLLAAWDDVTNRIYVGSIPQAECDPSGRWRFEEPGDYRLVVEDRTGGGGADYGFTLDMAPTKPDFEIYALRSSFVLSRRKDAKARFKVKVVRRNGFSGAVTVQGNADFAVERGTVPAGADEGEIVVVPMRRDWSGLKCAHFTAVAEDVAEGCPSRPVVPVREMEQAFAYTHLVPVPDFLFVIPPDLSGNADEPTWIDMPYDGFFPRRIIHPTVDMSKWKSASAAAYEALVDKGVGLVPVPKNCGDGVLAAKFVSSAADASRKRLGSYAVDTGRYRGEDAAVRSVLAGLSGLVTPKREYVTADERQTRILARAMAERTDNDIHLYVPGGTGNPLAGPVGAAARRLRDGGWCFDFVTDSVLTNASNGRIHRTVYLPKTAKPIPVAVRTRLDELAKKDGFVIVDERSAGADWERKLAKRARRESAPKGLLFARFGTSVGRGWYFIHNPLPTRVSGEWRFRIRGQAKVAYLMDVRTGKIGLLKPTKGGGFLLSVEPGSSAWIFVTGN